ncbi:zinc finger protein 862-like [Glandiceps talaboti]
MSLERFGFKSKRASSFNNENVDPAKRRKVCDPSQPQSPSRSTPSKSTERHRTSGWYPQWAEKYKWLYYEEGEGMFCKVCMKYQRSKPCGAWVKSGSTSYREDKIRQHENSTHHRVAVEMDASRKLTEKDGGITDAIQRVVTLEMEALIGALRCVYFLMKRELPHTTNLVPLLDLVKSLGCSYLDCLQSTERNHSYTSERTIQEMVWSIGEVIRSDVLSAVQKSKFLSVLIDETTDVAILKQMILYSKYMVANGDTKVSFLGMIEVPDGTASTLKNAVTTFADENGIQLTNRLAGFGSDGAAVMVGRKTGVAKQLKQVSSFMIGNHCVAHRLALAVSQAATKIPYVRKFNDTLDSLFRFYEYSPIRMSGLKEIQKTMENPVLKPKQAKAVRWLSHDAACDTLRKIYPCVVMSLHREASERNDVKAHGFVKIVEDWQFIATLYMMCDLLPHLSALSRYFQKSDLDFTGIKDQIQTTLAVLDAKLMVPGEFFRSVGDSIRNLNDNGFNISCPDQALRDFKTRVHDRFITSLTENIQARFPHSDILEAFTIFDPKLIPDAELCEVLDEYHYGEDKLEVLLDHYSTVVDEERCLVEWKCFLPTVFRKKDQLNFRETLCLLSGKLEDNFPNLSKLAQVALVIPVSTADCERGFSALKRVKTSPRNRLCERITNALLQVSIQGPAPADFDFQRAASIWGNIRNRRITLYDSCAETDL